MSFELLGEKHQNFVKSQCSLSEASSIYSIDLTNIATVFYHIYKATMMRTPGMKHEREQCQVITKKGGGFFGFVLSEYKK